MEVKEFIDIIQPKHSRTSCSDDDLNNGFYSNKGYTRCSRCTLLQILEEGYLPKSHTLSADFNIEENQKEAAEVKDD